MSKWNAWVLTKKGQALYAKVDAGKTKLVLTKMALGDGAPSDLENCTELNNKVIDMNVTSIAVENETTCTVEAELNTTALTDTLVVAEWGLYADDPDEGEILLGIATDSEPDKVEPTGGVAAYEQTMSMTLVTSAAANVTVNIDPSAFATMGALNDSLKASEDKLVAQIPTKTSDLINDSRFVAADAAGNVTVAGNLTAAKVYNAVYNDYAEFFPRGGETQAGDIIALDESGEGERYVRATEKSRCVVGVHSEDFAQIIGGAGAEPGENILKKNLPDFIPVALAGRVLVRLTGEAKAGAYVAPSGLPGVGRMASGPGDQSVGRIVEDKAGGKELRLVKILVGRS